MFPNELLQWLPTVLSGSHLPQEADTKARDKQFELYITITALFANSGFPVSLCEPDVQFEHEGKSYGIAAKRISSKRKLAKRVREGIKQLEKSGLRGLLAISADRLLSVPIPRVVAANEEGLDQAGTDLVEEFLNQYSKEIAPNIRPQAILGVAVNLVVPGFMYGQLGDIATPTTLRFLPRPDGSSENLSQNCLSRISMLASWMNPRQFSAEYSQRTRRRQCHGLQATKRSPSHRRSSRRSRRPS